MLHSLFHVLGRYHEHQRGDREEYIRIIKEHIIEGNDNLIQRKALFAAGSGRETTVLQRFIAIKYSSVQCCQFPSNVDQQP